MKQEPAAERDPKALVRESFTQRAGHFAGGAGSDLPAVLELVRQLGLRGEEDVVDVATGGGALAIALSPYAKRVTGVDLTPAMLEQARATARSQALENLSFVEGDAEALPVAEAGCDVVTCCRGVHHFQDVERSFAEMRRVLRPGGRLGIVDFATLDAPEEADFLEELERIREHGKMYVLPVSGWPGRLTSLGFHLRSIAWFLQPTSLAEWLRRVADRDEAAGRVHEAFHRAPSRVREALGYATGPDGTTWLRPYAVLVGQKAGD